MSAAIEVNGAGEIACGITPAALAARYLTSSPLQDCVATHDMQMLQATPCLTLSEIESVWRDYDVIGIDEGQFFPDLVSFCEVAANAGKTVLVAALESTFQRAVSACVRVCAFAIPRSRRMAASNAGGVGSPFCIRAGVLVPHCRRRHVWRTSVRMQLEAWSGTHTHGLTRGLVVACPA